MLEAWSLPVRLAAPATPQELPRLEERKASWYTKETAHALESVRCDRWGRAIGLAVVAMSAAMGTSAFAALGHNPSMWAKIVVGTLGVIAALAAAVKETAQYGKRSLAHESAEGEYEDIRYGVEDVQDKLRLGLITLEKAEADLERLENKAEELAKKAPALSNGAFTRAVKFIKVLRQQRKELFPHVSYD